MRPFIVNRPIVHPMYSSFSRAPGGFRLPTVKRYYCDSYNNNDKWWEFYSNLSNYDCRTPWEKTMDNIGAGIGLAGVFTNMCSGVVDFVKDICDWGNSSA